MTDSHSIPCFDVIIPIWNSPEWVDLCVQSVLHKSHLEWIHKIILVDDQSDQHTKELLADFQTRYPEQITVFFKEKNEGFVKTVNQGFRLVSEKSKYILLLNSDCLIPPYFFKRTAEYFEKFKQCGLLCPLSNNAANLSLAIPEGYSFIDFDQYLSGLIDNNLPFFKACTVVGNCLTIKKACYEKVGLLNEAYGIGYGEETEYQFRAKQAGFEACISPNIYVYHQGGPSFSEKMSDHYNEHKSRNWHLFMAHWKKDYEELLEDYKKNDPIRFIQQKINNHPIPKLHYDVIFVLPALLQNVGGIHTIVSICNYLILKGMKVGCFLFKSDVSFKDALFFNPLLVDTLEQLSSLRISTEVIVATLWSTFAACYFFSKENNCRLVYFIQGYEPFFDNGRNDGLVNETLKIPCHRFTISTWLKEKIQFHENHPVTLLPVGYDPHIFYSLSSKSSKTDDGFHVLFLLRNIPDKGDWVAKEVLTRICSWTNISKISVITMAADSIFDTRVVENQKISVIPGPLTKRELKQTFQKIDVYVDCSLHEGFGLIPLETMACGAVIVASDSGGVRDFIVNGKNGILVNETNQPEKFVEALDSLISEGREKLEIFKQKNKEIIIPFQYQNTMDNLFHYFQKIKTDSTIFKPVVVENYRILLRHKLDCMQMQHKIFHGYFNSKRWKVFSRFSKWFDHLKRLS